MVTGAPTRVTLDLSIGPSPATVEQHDDGTSGDRVSGDPIYGALLSAADIIAAMRADDVHRAFVGFLNLFGTTNVFRGNIFADVYASEAGTFPVARPTAAGTYVVSVIGTSGTIQHNTVVSLVVQ